MPVYNPQLQTDLDQLTDGFTKRRQWWDIMIARAETAREKHRLECRRTAKALVDTKKTYEGFRSGHKTISKHSTGDSDGLHALYAQQDGLRTAVKNPLGQLPLASPASVAPSFHSFYGAKFWARYEKLLQNGQHKQAERMLKRGGGPLRRALLFMTGNGYAVKSWRADIEAARAQIPAHKAAWTKLKAVDKQVTKAEKTTAKILRRLLKDDLLKPLLQGLQGQAGASPELAYLMNHAASGDIPSLGTLRKELKNQRAGFNLQTLKSEMDSIARQSAGNIQAARRDDRAAQARQSKAAKFIDSCKTSRGLETKTSLVKGGICLMSDMTERLEDFKLGIAGSAADAEKFVNAAVVKVNRWANQQDVESNMANIEQIDFNPQALVKNPGSAYVSNAIGGSVQRTGHFTAAAISGAFMAVVGRPTAKLFGALTHMFHGAGNGPGGPPQPPPPGGGSQPHFIPP